MIDPNVSDLFFNHMDACETYRKMVNAESPADETAARVHFRMVASDFAGMIERLTGDAPDPDALVDDFLARV